MKWPENKDFAFTVIDDTDDAFLENIKPVYDYLIEKNVITTKTVWVYPSRNEIKGDSLMDSDYLDYILELMEKGLEIGLHNVGSGDFNREEIIAGLEIFKNSLGFYPEIQINHSKNPDNIYWGYKRYSLLFRGIINLLNLQDKVFYGDDPESIYFWGDYSKKHIKYIRNRDFHGINTLSCDPLMPYMERAKEKYSNYWFSCSIGNNLKSFNFLVDKKNIDRLKSNHGCCIVYTHFGEDFVDENGILNSQFKDRIDYLSNQNGWFVPASKILDHLKRTSSIKYANPFYNLYLDLKWIKQRIFLRIKNRF